MTKEQKEARLKLLTQIGQKYITDDFVFENFNDVEFSAEEIRLSEEDLKALLI